MVTNVIVRMSFTLELNFPHPVPPNITEPMSSSASLLLYRQVRAMLHLTPVAMSCRALEMWTHLT